MLGLDGSALVIVERGGQGSSGMLYRPLVQYLRPVIMTRSCFKIFTSNLVKMATQSSSQSCPMDMSEPVGISLKTWADCALEESFLKSCKVAIKAGLIMFPLAT